MSTRAVMSGGTHFQHLRCKRMQRRTNNRWTPEDEAMLRAMAAAGKSCLQIALRLRRTKDAIKDRAHTLGIRFAPDKPRRGRAA